LSMANALNGKPFLRQNRKDSYRLGCDLDLAHHVACLITMHTLVSFTETSQSDIILHGCTSPLMFEAASCGPRFTISLKRSHLTAR